MGHSVCGLSTWSIVNCPLSFVTLWRSEYLYVVEELNIFRKWKWITIIEYFTPSKVALAVVARNHQGEVIKAWSKLCHLGSPLIAEAAAIQWAAQLAISKNWSNV